MFSLQISLGRHTNTFVKVFQFLNSPKKIERERTSVVGSEFIRSTGQETHSLGFIFNFVKKYLALLT